MPEEKSKYNRGSANFTVFYTCFRIVTCSASSVSITFSRLSPTNTINTYRPESKCKHINTQSRVIDTKDLDLRSEREDDSSNNQNFLQ